jgi:hypothetical protein
VIALEIIDAFLERMAVCCFVEGRPFSFRDFLCFELGGKQYRYKHGTIRNVFSKLSKDSKIERIYHTNPAFYKLCGSEVGKPITLDHTGDYLNHTQKDFHQWLKSLPTDNPAVHDIRLNFYSKGVWPTLSNSSSKLILNKDETSNKDISLREIRHDNCAIKTAAHRTDTVSVIVGCTDSPISIDEDGRIRLTNGLAIVHDRLKTLLEDGGYATRLNDRNLSVSSPMTWNVSMWHFGQDASYGYGGKKFEMNWGDALGVFRVYSKKKAIRFELQECPKTTLISALSRQPSLSLERLELLKSRYLV